MLSKAAQNLNKLLFLSATTNECVHFNRFLAVRRDAKNLFCYSPERSGLYISGFSCFGCKNIVM